MTASPLGCSNLCNLLEKRLVTASHLSLSYPMGSLASFFNNNNNIEDYKNLEIEELIKNSMHNNKKSTQTESFHERTRLFARLSMDRENKKKVDIACL
jgi:hypothetical protein